MSRPVGARVLKHTVLPCQLVSSRRTLQGACIETNKRTDKQGEMKDMRKIKQHYEILSDEVVYGTQTL